ncbi:MAG: S8 family serine peptidase [Anaerolineae bacterium]
MHLSLCAFGDLRQARSGVLLVLLTLLTFGSVREGETWPANVHPAVWAQTADGNQTTFLVILGEQADLRGAVHLGTREAKGRFVVGRLWDAATRTQAALRVSLDRRGVPYRSFYVINALAVTGGRELVAELVTRPEVARIAANPVVRAPLPSPALTEAGASAVEWNVQRVNADDVWQLGYTGQGVVVGGQDTGYDWDHPALISAYRGWNGITITHDYNWHDAIHSGGGICGPDSSEPCDDHGHGTHTMGTIVGDDGAGNQIGVAPGARWIGCRNMDQGVGTPATYIECFEFFLAPYPQGGTPSQGDPGRAPHVINNSWICPPSEGCDWAALQAVVENVRAAGILVVASAGNAGSACGTVRSPPALYEDAFSVGATNSSDDIASFSSRGPVTIDGSGRRKPDASAPGVGIRSSLPGGYGSMSGTSMAGPHAAGVAALVWSAAPYLIGDVAGTERLIGRTARPRFTAQGCGGDGPDQVPNNVYGWGIVDSLAAVVDIGSPLTVTKRASFAPGVPARLLEYTFAVTNTSAITLTSVVLTDALPANTSLAWASGVYTEGGGEVTWGPATLGPGGHLTATLAVTASDLPRGSRVLNDRYGVRAAEVTGPVRGAPVESTVPWRVLLFPVFRGWMDQS